MNRIPVIVGILLFCGTVRAQPAIELSNYQQKYPGESAILLHKNQHVDISVENKSLSILTEFYEEQFYLDSKASLYAEESILFSGFYEVFDIEGKTYYPEKRKYKQIRIKQITEKDEFSSGIFYDDIKSKNFVYPSLKEGAKTSLFYRQRTKDPHFLKGFYLAEFIPIENEEFVIKSDKNIELAFSYFNTTADECGFTKTETSDRIIYKWSKKNVPKVVAESSSPSQLNYIPHIIPRIASYTVEGEKIKILSDANDLHSWYYSLISEVDQHKSEELINITDSLTKGIDEDLEKVKAIYNWVQNNIKYIAVEDGLGGFIPRAPSTVCENRYGDCKDMSSIISQMMDIAGIEAHITWVGTRDIPYSYGNVPTPNVDNHMIATYIDGEEYYFLDATGQYSPIDLPSSFIQGKEVMINFGENYQLVKVPEIPALRNQLLDTIQLQIKDGELIGKGKTLFTGYRKVEMTEQITRLDPDNRIRFFKEYLNKGSNKFLIDKLEVSNLSDKYNPLVVSYDFNIADYVKRNEDELYVNLNLDKLFLNSVIKEDRIQAIERDYKTNVVQVVKLALPKSFKVDYMPENSHFDHANFSYDIKYHEVEESLILTTNITIDNLLLNPENFDEWNEMIKGLRLAYAESILLKQRQ